MSRELEMVIWPRVVCGGRDCLEAVVPPLQKEYCMYSKRVPDSFTCTPDLSRANPSPGSLVAILTFLTQPMAASSKSSSKSSGRTKTQVSEAESERAVKPRQDKGQKQKLRKKYRGVMSQTAHTHKYTPWRLASIKPALPLHLAVTH